MKLILNSIFNTKYSICKNMEQTKYKVRSNYKYVANLYEINYCFFSLVELIRTVPYLQFYSPIFCSFIQPAVDIIKTDLCFCCAYFSKIAFSLTTRTLNFRLSYDLNLLHQLNHHNIIYNFVVIFYFHCSLIVSIQRVIRDTFMCCLLYA